MGIIEHNKKSLYEYLMLCIGTVIMCLRCYIQYIILWYCKLKIRLVPLLLYNFLNSTMYYFLNFYNRLVYHLSMKLK